MKTDIAPLVNGQQVSTLMTLAHELDKDELSQLFADLARDPDVSPVVVDEVRSQLAYEAVQKM